jgi:chorismate mutase
MPDADSAEDELLRIDARLIELLRERQALCGKIRAARAGHGQPSIDTAHDRSLCRRFRVELGPDGAALGPTVLQLCRH